MRSRIAQEVRKLPREAHWSILALAFIVLGLGTWAVVRDRGREMPSPEPSLEPPGLVVSPTGEDVSRLTPLRVTFPQPPDTTDGAQLLRLEPAAPGSFLWLSDRTLLYQPDFPGLLRGEHYVMTIAPQPEAGLPAPFTQDFTTTGLLKVEHAIPRPGDKEIPQQAQILVQFSRAVAPLTLLSEQTSAPVIISDLPLVGQGEWLNTSLYRFVPERLRPATEYHLRIPAGLSSLPDGVLKEDFIWSFTTESPRLAMVTPSDRTAFAGPQQQAVLTFNQAMDRASVEAGFQLKDADGDPIPGAFVWSQEDSVATFTPAARMAPGPKQILVPKGLKGAAGGETQREWLSSFASAGPPAVTSTSPMDGRTGVNAYGASITFGHPMNLDSFEGRVSVSNIDPDDIRLSVGEGPNLYINVRFKPLTRYTVSIARGAVDRFGQSLGPYSFSFTTGDYARPASLSYAVPSQLVTFSASTEPLLYYHAINFPETTFSLFPLTPEEARRLRQARSIPLTRTRQGVQPFEPAQPPLRTWRERSAGELNEVVLGSTSLSGGGPLPLGDYYVRSVSGQDPPQLMFSVVNTALITKVSHDELLVWALNHDTGEPLAGVKLHADGTNLKEEQATDSQGLATFVIPSPVLRRGPYLITLDDGGHRGVASTYWEQGIERYRLNLPTEGTPRVWVGHVYTDRPIYRPGEQVEYKAVLRLDDDAAYQLPPPDAPVDVVIRDPAGKDLRREPVRPNEFGTSAGSFLLPSDAAIGDYILSLQDTGGGNRLLANTSFLVAEFRKPEYQVVVETDKATYADGDRIVVKATASFYFGGSVADVPARLAVLSSPFALRVPGFERYSFSDFDYYRPAVVSQTTRGEGKSTTDAQGVASFSVPVAILGNEGSQRFEVWVAVADESAQEVGASTTVTVHPAAFYAGIRADQNVVTVGKEATIQLVTADTQGGLLPGKPVAVKVYEREWITTKEQTAEGARRYRSEPRDTLVATLTATTDAEAKATARFTPRSPGSLRLVAEVTDAVGRVARSATFLWVSGEGYARWRVTNDDTLQLVADKDNYEVGDTAQVLVPAPFEGAVGLVTVERGRIISRTTARFPTNSELLRIPILDGHVPNIFVSVVLYRPPTAADPVPRYKVGYVKLPVSTRSRVLNVSIQPDRAQTQPREKVRYDIKVTDTTGRGIRAELSVAVVDKALFSLADERGPTGLRAFWFERGLGVATASSLAVSIDRANDVIAELQQGGKGGGGLEEERQRQEFRNTAFWVAQLATGEDGTASVEVTMPDNLTTWRAQARAVSGDTLVGEGTHELVSTLPLLLRPALPRFLRVGDSTTLRMLVRNATKQPSAVRVSLTAEGLEMTGEAIRRASVPAEESVVLEWPAKATEAGHAKLTFTATGSGDLKDAVLQELPVHPAVTQETTATGGVVTDEPRAEAIYLPGYAVQRGGVLNVSVQASLVGSLKEELELLAPQTWENAERIASRIVATSGVQRAERSAGSLAEIPLDRDLASLVNRQRNDGGWGWCDRPDCNSDPNISAWVLMSLGEAKRAGRTVDQSVLLRATEYVNNYFNRVTEITPAEVNQKALLSYALASVGYPFLGRTFALQEQYRSQFTNWGRAYLVLAMEAAGVDRNDSHLQQTLEDLTAAVIPSANGSHWEDKPMPGFTHTNVRTTALALGALARVASDHPLIEETVRWLTVARAAGKWASTIERAQAILWLSEFTAKTGELGGDYTYRARLNNQDILSGRFQRDAAARPVTSDVPLTRLPLGQQSVLTFLRDFTRAGRLYYVLNLRYQTPATEVDSLSRGIAVFHEYSALGDASKRIDRIRLGETVRVKVTVVAPKDLNYVVVEDLLPAGLEPIDLKIKTVDPKLKAQLEEERRKAAGVREAFYGGCGAPWSPWYFSPWQQANTRDDRVTLFADKLGEGFYEYIYYARATGVGDYWVAPAHAQETYFPEVFGRGDSSRFTVVP